MSADHRLHNVSASRSSLLLSCSWWAQPGVRLPEEPDDIKLAPDIPRFGRAFHKVMESWLLNEPILIKDISELYAVDERRLENYFERASTTMEKLFRDRGWWERERIVERKLAYDPFSDTARWLQSSGERDYGGRHPNELPGTMDLALPPALKMPLVVLDWKSGQSSYDAANNPQIHTLALGLTRILHIPKSSSVHGMIVRIDDEVMELSEGAVSAETLDRHRLLLRSKLREALSNNAAMRPGLYCKYCSALEQCPAHRDPLAVIEAGSEMLSPDVVSHVYPRLMAAEQLLHKLRDRIKKSVEMNGPIELENGKILKIVEFDQDNLSQSTITRALGKADGAELISELRDKGVIEKSHVAQLRVVNQK